MSFEAVKVNTFGTKFFSVYIWILWLTHYNLMSLCSSVIVAFYIPNLQFSTAKYMSCLWQLDVSSDFLVFDMQFVITVLDTLSFMQLCRFMLWHAKIVWSLLCNVVTDFHSLCNNPGHVVGNCLFMYTVQYLCWYEQASYSFLVACSSYKPNTWSSS